MKYLIVVFSILLLVKCGQAPVGNLNGPIYSVKPIKPIADTVAIDSQSIN